MKLFLIVFLCLVSFKGSTQTFDHQIQNSKSMLKPLLTGDSIAYYQCHVENGTQQLITASGQTITGKSLPYTITEKFLIVKTPENYLIKYFTSSLNVFPNKKFSGLKIREKEYWHFKLDNVFVLNDSALKVLILLENRGREAMEYDYPITKYTTNQLIIKHKKNFKQLVIDGPYYFSQILRPTKP